MKREDIGIHTIVKIELTPFGHEVLDDYLDHEDERAGRPVRERQSLNPGVKRTVEMPLWEVMKVFGPSMVSSARLPFVFLGYFRNDAREERERLETERLASDTQEVLCNLAKALGIADDYKAPEQVRVAATMFCACAPPRVPNGPGWWWFGRSVIQVVERDGKLIARLNGRTKPISDAQPWRGRAIVDPRVPMDDIPF
jgi:hypothetical protein